jgi:hypothetical protein
MNAIKRSREEAMERYFREGTARAMALGNRGTIRFSESGQLAPDIMEAYERHGFYVFEGVISPAELAELEAEYLEMMDRMPGAPDAKVDRHGRPAAGSDLEVKTAYWAKPLSDPFAGTEKNQGRHTFRMFEPEPAADAPAHVIFSVVAPIHFSEAYLRMCGHPDLLRLSAAVNGEDFVPFQEGIVIKRPHEGASFSWHQDGTTHWDSPAWNQHSHGVNLMPQLYGSTAANGVWYVPGTQRAGRLDMTALDFEPGSDRVRNAVPLICAPGDVAISNRQVVHGSFANTSDDIRVTLGFGFHPRASVLGATGYDFDTNQPVTFDAERVCKRCEMIGYAIDARRQHFPDEAAYVYRPHAEAGETYLWDDTARREIRNYSKRDLRI